MPAPLHADVVPATSVSRRSDLREMAATDGGASSSATPAWPGTVSRRLNGVWRLQTPPARGSSVAPETLQICFRNRGDGSVARVAELAVMASGQRLESVELECVSRAHEPPTRARRGVGVFSRLKQPDSDTPSRPSLLTQRQARARRRARGAHAESLGAPRRGPDHALPEAEAERASVFLRRDPRVRGARTRHVRVSVFQPGRRRAVLRRAASLAERDRRRRRVRDARVSSGDARDISGAGDPDGVARSGPGRNEGRGPGGPRATARGPLGSRTLASRAHDHRGGDGCDGDGHRIRDDYIRFCHGGYTRDGRRRRARTRCVRGNGADKERRRGTRAGDGRERERNRDARNPDEPR